MKHRLNPLLIAAVVALPTMVAHADNSYSNAVAALSPVAYWPLNETTQPPAAYVATNIGTLGAKGNAYYGNMYYPSGTGFNLSTLFGGPTTGATSDGDSAAQFNGGAHANDNSEYMIIPQVDKNLTFGVPFSAEAWVMPGGGDPNDPTGASYASTEWTAIIKKGGGGAFYTENGDTQNNTYGWTLSMAGAWSLCLPDGWYENGTTFLRTNAVFIADFYNGANGNTPSLEFMVPFQEPTPTWFHLVLTYDGTNANFYVNGALAATTVLGLPQSTNQVVAPGQSVTSATGAYVFHTVNGVGYAQDTINPICIGNINESYSIISSGYNTGNFIGFNCQNFNGAMDEVAVYTNALSSTAVLKHYQDATASDHTLYTNDVLSSAPIVYLRMDEPAYTEPPADFSTYPPANSYGSMTGANGLYQPGVIPGISGPAVAGFGTTSSAAQLNGFDAAIDVGAGGLFGTALDPQGTQPFTVAYWFKANPSDCYGRFQTILGRGDQGWRSGIDNSGHLRWNPGAGPEISSPVNYNDGAWHQVVGVSDGSTASLYVDGQLSTSGTGVGSLAGSSLDLLIGGAPDYTTSDKNFSQQRYFPGQIAQVAFFGSALTGAQVQSLYFAAELKPSITQQPQGITLGLGSGGSLTVGAAGNPTLAYQWYQGATKLTDVAGNLSGSTTATLSISNTTTNNAGNYAVVVTNSFGATTSQVAVVTVSLAPNILAQPTPSSATRYAGNQVSYSVGSVGANPLSYQWYNGNTRITGATTSNLVVTTVAGTNTYSVLVTNAYGSATSSVVTVIGRTFVPPATGGFTVNFAVAPGSTAANVYVGQGAYSDPGNDVWNAIPSASGASTGFAYTSSSNQTLVTASLIFGFNNGAGNAAITNGNPSWLLSYEDAVNSGSPGVGTAGAPTGQLTIQNVPQGSYKLYLYGQNYDGNRGSVFAVAPGNGGIPDQGMDTTTNAQPANTPAVPVEGDNFVFFRGVKPDASGNIVATYIPNPFGTLTGEAPFNGAQLVGTLLSIKPAASGQITVSWSGGTLVSSGSLTGPYNPVAGTSPLTMSPSGPAQFFRVQQ